MTKAKKDTQILTIRFPVALVKKLDRYVKKFAREYPGISFRRTDAIRLFVERGVNNPTTLVPQPEEPPAPPPAPKKPLPAKKPKAKLKAKKDTKIQKPAQRKPGAGKTKPRKKR